MVGRRMGRFGLVEESFAPAIPPWNSGPFTQEPVSPRVQAPRPGPLGEGAPPHINRQPRRAILDRLSAGRGGAGGSVVGYGSHGVDTTFSTRSLEGDST